MNLIKELEEGDRLIVQALIGSVSQGTNKSGSLYLNVELRDLLDKIGDENFWSGASAQRLKEELDSLKEKFPIFSEDIKECSNNLTKMVEEYQKADAEINNM